MPKIAPVGESSNVFALIHGDPSVGKTHLVGTLGKQYKTLLMRSPVDHADPIRGSGVQETVVHDWEETFEVMEYMRHEGGEWDWFVVDSLSLIQDVMLDDVYQTVIDKKGGRMGERAKYGPDKGEYRVNMWRIEQFIRYTVGAGAGFNLMIVCHSFWKEWVDDEGNTAEKYVPWVQGKMMSEKITGMMNFVGYMETRTREVRGEKRKQRVLYTDTSERFVAKNQFKLPDGSPTIPEGRIIDPKMPELLEAIGRGLLQTPEDRKEGRSRPTGGKPSLGRRSSTRTTDRPSGRTTGRSTGRTTGRQ